MRRPIALYIYLKSDWMDFAKNKYRIRPYRGPLHGLPRQDIYHCVVGDGCHATLNSTFYMHTQALAPVHCPSIRMNMMLHESLTLVIDIC